MEIAFLFFIFLCNDGEIEGENSLFFWEKVTYVITPLPPPDFKMRMIAVLSFLKASRGKFLHQTSDFHLSWENFGNHALKTHKKVNKKL